MTDQIENPSAASPRRFKANPAVVAPALALVGLVIVSLLTIQVYRSFTPTLPNSETPTPTPLVIPSDDSESTEAPTAMPSATIVTEVGVPGELVYVRNGALWIQSDKTARQLTQPAAGTEASQPAFSPDGQWIYYIDTRTTTGRWYNPDRGVISQFMLHYPVLCRIRPDGTGRQDIMSSLYKKGSNRTNYFLRQPSINPAGTVAVVASDGPLVAYDPTGQQVLIHYINLGQGKMGAPLPLPNTVPYGLSDPEYSPDGSAIAYTMEGWSGGKGAPSVWIYKNGSTRRLAAGYRAPSWAPTGRYVAATRVSGDSMNVVVLDANSGKMVSQVTSDGASWGAVWSPDGDKLIYMHMTGATVDLNMVYISNTGEGMSFRVEPRLTDFSGLDGGSTATWYMPGYGPTPTPSPAPSTTETATPSLPSATAAASASAQPS